MNVNGKADRKDLCEGLVNTCVENSVERPSVETGLRVLHLLFNGEKNLFSLNWNKSQEDPH